MTEHAVDIPESLAAVLHLWPPRFPLSSGPLHFSFFFAEAKTVSSLCRVSLVDGDRVAHTVTVSASSLYEAAVLGLAEFAERLPTPSE